MKKAAILLILALALLLVIAVSLLLGASPISLHDLLNALMNPGTITPVTLIVWKLRVPRILLGMMVGAGLATSGCVMQSILRNPLADPYTLGISGGAALGVMLAYISGLASISFLMVPLCAFAGTLISTVIMYAIASRRSFSPSTLILSGIILGFFFSSLVTLISSLADPNKLKQAIVWILGDLSSTQSSLLIIAAMIVVIGIGFTALYWRELDLLALGEEKAFQLGLDTSRATRALFVASSAIISACVSVSGVIGFVGLVIPHLARYIIGPRHNTLIIASALLGAAFLVACDTTARTIISPIELPVGVITGIIGGIFVVLFLLKKSTERFF